MYISSLRLIANTCHAERCVVPRCAAVARLPRSFVVNSPRISALLTTSFVSADNKTQSSTPHHDALPALLTCPLSLTIPPRRQTTTRCLPLHQGGRPPTRLRIPSPRHLPVHLAVLRTPRCRVIFQPLSHKLQKMGRPQTWHRRKTKCRHVDVQVPASASRTLPRQMQQRRSRRSVNIIPL